MTKERIKGIVIILVIGVVWAGAGLGIGLLTGIIGFNNPDPDEAASIVNDSCVSYFSDIVNESESSVSVPSDIAADRSKRITFASAKTVKDALENAGIYEQYKNMLSQFCVDQSGNIVAGKHKITDPENLRSDITLSENTTLGELYENILKISEES